MGLFSRDMDERRLGEFDNEDVPREGGGGEQEIVPVSSVRAPIFMLDC